MTRRFPAGQLLVVLTAVLVGALLAAVPPAFADPGPAPAPREYRVLQKLHTDAISTFIDAGAFALGSKADVFEGLGTRLDPERVWFHVDDASKLTVPAGMGFIAPAGSEIWVAPQSNPGGAQLWPGFSTESVPGGAIDGDQTSLRLVKLEGPGDLELFTTGGFGEVTRLWSSDENITSFRVGRTHMHANWAFTRPGTYKLTVEGSALRNGAPVAASATYTFVAGALPQTTATTTTIAASATAITAGESVTLTATVAPGAAAGYAEFRDGATVLGHVELDDGTASLAVSNLGLGKRSLTATFVPKVANLAGTSTSAAVDVTVSEPGSVPFSVTGILPSYAVGDTLTATVAGATLGEGQNYQWMVRRVGATQANYTLSSEQSAAGRLVQRLDASHDRLEISARLRNGTTVVAQTPWVPLQVQSTVESLTLTYTGAGSPAYVDDPLTWTMGGRALAEGESVRLAFSAAGGPWGSATNVAPVVQDGSTFAILPFGGTATYDFSLQVIRDGVIVAQSAPTTVSWRQREALVDGVQSVYRPGNTLRATAEVFPVKAGLTYSWLLRSNATGDTATLKTGTDASALTLDQPLTGAPGEYRLSFVAQWRHSDGRTIDAARRNVPIHISAADPAEQVLVFNTLSAHYHQGGTVNLQLVADPGLAAGDRIDWQWRWPGETSWRTVPGASGLSHPVVAEQALDGVQVRAALAFAGGGDPVVAEAVTIHVDDHGAAANQKLTVSGPTDVPAGDTVALTAGVAPSTVLDRYQWYEGGEPITGANAATYTFTATTGRTLTVAVLKPDGSVAYGPSAPVTVAVRDRTVQAPQPVGGTVPATLALTLGASATFGAFTPGVAKEYTASTTATVISTAGDAALSVGEPGRLANDAFTLAEPLRVELAKAAWTAPVSDEVVDVTFKQAVTASEPLRTGSYSKTLTFTLSTTQP